MLIAKNGKELHLLPEMSNRHGLIAGSSGSGKTVTLRVMAENFSKIGVPVFMADVKGDLTGLDRSGIETPAIVERVASMHLKDFSFEGFPTQQWDVFGQEGEEVKVSINKLTPLLLSRLLNLSDVQNESLAQIFKIVGDYSNKISGVLNAQDGQEGSFAQACQLVKEYSSTPDTIELNNIEDMTTTINKIIDFSANLEPRYGKISKQSYTSIQRSMLMLEQDGKDVLFSDTPFDVTRFIKTEGGYGVINIFKARRLYENPTVYATFLLWLIAELYKALPECGDIKKPKMVFFFDEAHLLFDEAPKVLIDNVEKLVRLIRSKGVGIFFITQRPSDIPDKVLAQLSNRVQHSLRAFTPKEQKSIRTIAQTFRNESRLDVEKAIGRLKIGEALVSFLDAEGSPVPVKKALVCPPRSNITGDLVSIKTNELSTVDSIFESII